MTPYHKKHPVFTAIAAISLIVAIAVIGLSLYALKRESADRANLQSQFEDATNRAHECLVRSREFLDVHGGPLTADEHAESSRLRAQTKAAMQETTRLNGLLLGRQNHFARYSVIAIIASILPQAWVQHRAWSKGRVTRRLKKGQCPECGYDLRATPGRCPECGHSA